MARGGRKNTERGAINCAPTPTSQDRRGAIHRAPGGSGEGSRGEVDTPRGRSVCSLPSRGSAMTQTISEPLHHLQSLALPFERATLGNGLRVVVHPDRSLPLAAINLWYHVGSKNERPGRTGFAHLFEHMLFQGSQHVPTNEHFRYLQQVGGVANGSTWYDRTNYFETLPAHHLDLGLWLESDRMGFFLPAMTAEKLEMQ